MAQVRPEALPGRLRSALPAVVWIHGDEPLFVQEASDAVRARARELQFDERQVLQVERGFKADEIRNEAGSGSLFATSKLIEIRFPGKPAKDMLETIAALLEQLPDEVRLLVTSARLDRATTESANFTRIERAGFVVPVYPLERSRLKGWIAERLRRQGQSADDATLELIAARVEGNALAADQEIRKLGLLFDGGELPVDETRDAVLDVARYSAFDLVDAALSGDRLRSVRTLSGLEAEGEAPPLVLWALADAVRTLMRLHEGRASGRAESQVLREARVFGPREQLYRGALQRIDQALARRALQMAAHTDTIIKGLNPGEGWQALAALALTIAGAPVLEDPSK